VKKEKDQISLRGVPEEGPKRSVGLNRIMWNRIIRMCG
jgi:hypothetical protein